MLRIIQVGTGLTGRHALSTIRLRSDLELVGLWVFSPEKEGRSVAEILGDGSADAPDVRATRDMERLIAQPADCVLFMPADPTISSPHEPVRTGQICSISSAGS